MRLACEDGFPGTGGEVVGWVGEETLRFEDIGCLLEGLFEFGRNRGWFLCLHAKVIISIRSTSKLFIFILRKQEALHTHTSLSTPPFTAPTPFRITPLTSSNTSSVLSSKLSTTSTTPLQFLSSASLSSSFGAEILELVLLLEAEDRVLTTSSLSATADARSRSASARSRAFCASSERAKAGSSERWKGKSSAMRAEVVRVVLSNALLRLDWRLLKPRGSAIVYDWSGGRDSHVGLELIKLRCVVS
jgi:hypothetical protein